MKKKIIMFKGTDEDEEEKDEYKSLVENELKLYYKRIPILSFQTNEDALLKNM